MSPQVPGLRYAIAPASEGWRWTVYDGEGVAHARGEQGGAQRADRHDRGEQAVRLGPAAELEFGVGQDDSALGGDGGASPWPPLLNSITASVLSTALVLLLAWWQSAGERRALWLRTSPELALLVAAAGAVIGGLLVFTIPAHLVSRKK